MSARLAKFLIVAAAMTLAMEAAQSAPISNEAFERLRSLEAQHCGIGRPQPAGDVPRWEWRRAMRLCKEPAFKLDKLIQRCRSGVSENREICARLMQWHVVKRYPPPDPRRRK
jgi:hypothetical protein